ncbi:uncharacterized protein PHACADRAFT_266212 [Phanerochaete carnosa HHB-10118-sp]|uniref:Uncharacterized protein n=1 Tax=Phanerochaete carnosa (strain HHB-10118-sp) TaxID=650164 RepID=K5VQ01_PHACS|nr:uncharacterized protein PHACADRAFT_266212 [Phanerochaete carnosa HHB-10118-sp]EKM48674.1 hypothetical protein PHACADRAFT_266212 [Phanerochaete carnosa HHB-10118-sp]
MHHHSFEPWEPQSPWCGRGICVLTPAELGPCHYTRRRIPCISSPRALQSTIPAIDSMPSEPPSSSHGHSRAHSRAPLRSTRLRTTTGRTTAAARTALERELFQLAPI